MRYHLSLAAFLLSATAAFTQTPTPLEVSTLAQQLDSVRYGLHVEDGVLSGPGAAVLTGAITHSRYILIGEDHLTREIPQFTTGICKVAAKQGLAALAMEVSPEAAGFVMQGLHSPDRWQQMVAQTHSYPSSIAFLDSRQEEDMIAACAKTSQNPSFKLWGLDYNFLGSAGWLIDEMLAAHPGPKAKAALLRLKTVEQKDAAEARAKASSLPLFLLSEKSQADISEAEPAIKQDGGAKVNATFAHLVTSYRIYREYYRDRAVSDVMRATLLKTNFRDAMNGLPPSEKAGKIIVKFGDSHLFKGINDNGNLNLGDYIAEMATMEGESSLHIRIRGADGTAARLTGYGKPAGVEAASPKAEQEPWLNPFVAGAIPGEWTLYDLRGLSHRIPGPIDSEIRRALEGYDFLVIVPRLTPADMAD